MRSTITSTVRRSLALRHSPDTASNAHPPWWQRWWAIGATEDDPRGEAGMATVEYAIGTLAAAAFAGLLLAIMRSGSLRGTLQGIIESALNV